MTAKDIERKLEESQNSGAQSQNPRPPPAHQVLNTNLFIMIFKIDLLVIEYMLIILTITLLIAFITLI